MSRHLCFTWFIPEGYDYDPKSGPMDINFDEVRYVICQLEACPETKRLHFQGYVQFFDKKRYKGAADALAMPKAHFEKPKGSVEDNQRYCSKSDTRVAGPWEFGEAIDQGFRTDLKKACDLVNKGDMRNVDDTVYVKFHRGLHQLALRNAVPRTEMPQVYVIWGATGTGKSHTAREMTPNAYWKPPGMWWDGYTSGQDVIIDDFDPNEWTITQILRLCDKYPLKVPYKGGFVEFNSPKIIITTHFDPVYWWYHRFDELERRITEVIEM